MNRIILTSGFLILLASTCLTTAVQAQTGSHIKDNTVKTPETVVWFSEPREITDIRLLLQQGQKQEAVKMARDFLQKLRGIGGSEAQPLLWSVGVVFGVNHDGRTGRSHRVLQQGR